MAKSIVLAWTNPVDEASDKEYNAWYSGTHVPQVIAHVPGVTGARRYRVVDLPGVGGPPPTATCASGKPTPAMRPASRPACRPQPQPGSSTAPRPWTSRPARPSSSGSSRSRTSRPSSAVSEECRPGCTGS